MPANLIYFRSFTFAFERMKTESKIQYVLARPVLPLGKARSAPTVLCSSPGATWTSHATRLDSNSLEPDQSATPLTLPATSDSRTRALPQHSAPLFVCLRETHALMSIPKTAFEIE